jgi:hypothetical protein
MDCLVKGAIEILLGHNNLDRDMVFALIYSWYVATNKQALPKPS